MYYIVGLGNPGTEHKGTRHNVGFTVVERFIEDAHLSSLYDSRAVNGRISESHYENASVTLLLPNTFMNASGSAVAKLVPKDAIDRLLVVYDDIDLPLGEVKVSFGRGAGGHNGITSILNALGSKDFTRVRIGIGKKSLFTGTLKRPKGNALSNYVLGAFTAKEEKVLQGVIEVFPRMVSMFIKEGKEKLMQEFNQ